MQTGNKLEGEQVHELRTPPEASKLCVSTFGTPSRSRQALLYIF